MESLFSNYLGCYSYSFQGSVEWICITITVSLFLCRSRFQVRILLWTFQELIAITFSWLNDGRLILIHLHCWELLLFLTIQRQRCIKILCPRDPEFYTPLALNSRERQRPPALEVYKNQFPKWFSKFTCNEFEKKGTMPLKIRPRQLL